MALALLDIIAGGLSRDLGRRASRGDALRAIAGWVVDAIGRDPRFGAALEVAKARAGALVATEGSGSSRFETTALEPILPQLLRVGAASTLPALPSGRSTSLALVKKTKTKKRRGS